MHQEALLRLFPNAFDLPEGTLDGRLGPQVPVEGNAKAVGLVTDALQHLQGLRIPVDKERIRIPHPYHQFHPFRQADHRHAVQEAQLCQRLVRIAQLAFAAIDHNQLGNIVRSLRQHARIAPVHHLLHGGKVVGANHRLYLEAPVILLARLCVAEHHAGRYGVRTLDVGVVEALHVARQFFHANRLAKVLHHGHAPGVRVCVLPLLDAVEMEFFGVLGAELQEG